MNSQGDGHDRKTVEILKQSAPHTAFATFLFVVSGVWGALSPEVGNRALEAFTVYAQGLMGLNTPELIFAIFIRNAMAAAGAILLGIVFGLVPLAGSVFNGILIGTVLRMFPEEFWKLLPHGIFELPAMFIAWGLGLWVGWWFLQSPRWQRLKTRMSKSIQVFFVLILPLLGVAAVIEGVAAHLYR